MRIPSKCYTTVFFTKVETVIIQLNLTCHFEEKIDLKTTTEIIPLHCCHHKTIENVLPISVCLIKFVGRAILSVYSIFPSGAMNYFSVFNVSEYENDKQVYRLRTD